MKRKSGDAIATFDLEGFGRFDPTVAHGGELLFCHCQCREKNDQEPAARSSLLERFCHDALRLFLQSRQVRLTDEGLRIDLVDVFGSAGTSGEPTILGLYFETTER